ncbi:hypothetical protein FQV37_235 [Psychrobacter nivimaris]|uniref:Uncharacterized protein n=1 Tax=Psychrobacter nivimaris TaxID=281738 RepID=A0A6N7BZJ9_9GAMM|nr:hypothetical protein FQV37_235 [Psychrobacter nivimaris]
MYLCTKKTSTKKKATENKVAEKISPKIQLLRITLNAPFFIITDTQVHNTQL